jgi:hypothetical protein
LDRLIEAPWVNNVKTSEVKDEVASLTRKGNQVLVKFKKVKAKATYQEGCRQTNRVIRIEPNGTVVYELVGCRWVTETVDRTERDVWLPAEEAAALGVGYTVALRVDSTTASRKAFLLWAKDKSGGAVWASGFTPGSVAAGAAKR